MKTKFTLKPAAIERQQLYEAKHWWYIYDTSCKTMIGISKDGCQTSQYTRDDLEHIRHRLGQCERVSGTLALEFK